MSLETRPGTWPALEELIPHRGSMLLLSRVLGHEADVTCCEVDLSRVDFIRRPDGSLPPWVCIEYMAQCVAAHEALRAADADRSFQFGLLMGARHVHFPRAHFPGQGWAEVVARNLSGRVGLGALSYACKVREPQAAGDGGLWAEGTLNVALVDAGSAPRGADSSGPFGDGD